VAIPTPRSFFFPLDLMGWVHRDLLGHFWKIKANQHAMSKLRTNVRQDQLEHSAS
jgi:hypothetical protein